MLHSSLSVVGVIVLHQILLSELSHGAVRGLGATDRLVQTLAFKHFFNLTVTRVISLICTSTIIIAI